MPSPSFVRPALTLNPRLLQTFYLVVTHGGISRAVPHMPYGIQQPAISQQIAELEEAVGQKLFQRQPFQLTSAGRALYRPVQSSVHDLAEAIQEIQRGAMQMRIGAEDILMQPYLAPAVTRMREAYGELQFSLRWGPESEMTRRLQEGDVDLVVAALADRAPTGLAKRLVAEVNLALLVGINASITSAEQLWTSGPNLTERLVCAPLSEAVGQIFSRGLRRGGIRWPHEIETNSLLSVSAFVADTSRIGVTLDLPNLPLRADMRMLPLCGFEPARVAVLWRPGDTKRLKPFVQIIAGA